MAVLISFTAAGARHWLAEFGDGLYKRTVSIPGDNPINNSEQDALDRAAAAHAFANDVWELDASEGVVVG